VSKVIRAVAIAGASALCALNLPDEAGENSLAMQLSNPVAALISVPMQFNYDQDIGPADDGDRWLLNVQPVIPFSLNDDWNLISRTILPLVRQSDIFPGAGTQSGIGDVVQSIFFSPKGSQRGQRPFPFGRLWPRLKVSDPFGQTPLATLAMLYWLGVKPSYSRPRVSDDNAYAESLFRTAKYRPEFPAKGFANLDAALGGL